MHRKRSERLQSLRRVMEMHLDRAALKLSRANQKWQSEKNQAQTLSSYYQEYQIRPVVPNSEPVSVYKLQQHYYFLDRMQALIDQQMKNIQIYEKAVIACREEWHKQNNYYKHFMKFLDKVVLEEREYAWKKEQAFEEGLFTDRYGRKSD
jgi:flagellar export protein FliJ